MDVRTRNALLQPTHLEGQTHQEHSMNASVKLHTAVAATAIVLFTAVSALAETFAPGVGEDGNITLPAEDYRKDWSYLGAFSVLGEEGAAEIHIVYPQPKRVAAYRIPGPFPADTVRVKALDDGAYHN